jgi:hypothetical protein
MAIGWYGTGSNIRDSFDRTYGAGPANGVDGYGIFKAGKCFEALNVLLCDWGQSTKSGG